MNKSMIAVVCVALLVLNALVVFANVSSYTQARSMTSMGGVERIAQPRQVAGCNTNIAANADDVYFIGNARKDCIENNKHNYMCQQRCFEQVKLMLRAISAGRMKPAYERSGCKNVDPSMLSMDNPKSSCYFRAANLCTEANPASAYCQRRCVQKLYTTCRQNIMTMMRLSTST